MALVMLDEIMKNNKQGKKTVLIVPVGPTQQHPILAKLVNQLEVRPAARHSIARAF